MGTDWEWTVQRGKRTLAEVKHYGYVVDLLAQLQVKYKMFRTYLLNYHLMFPCRHC